MRVPKIEQTDDGSLEEENDLFEEEEGFSCLESMGDMQETGQSRRKRQRLDHLSPEEKLMRRKLKNRVAAQYARDRKKAHMDHLELRVKQLEQERLVLIKQNAILEKENHKLRRENDYISKGPHPDVNDKDPKSIKSSKLQTFESEVLIYDCQPHDQVCSFNLSILVFLVMVVMMVRIQEFLVVIVMALLIQLMPLTMTCIPLNPPAEDPSPNPHVPPRPRGLQHPPRFKKTWFQDWMTKMLMTIY